MDTEDEETGRPSIDWLKDVWMYLREHFPDISQFEGLPMLPIKLDSQIHVVCLESPPRVVLTAHNNETLPGSVQKLLSACGFHLVDCLPEVVLSHAVIMDKYVY